MRKLKLEIDELRVESFGTERSAGRGTVQGFYSLVVDGCDPDSLGYTCGAEATCQEANTCAFESCDGVCGSDRCSNGTCFGCGNLSAACYSGLTGCNRC